MQKFKLCTNWKLLWIQNVSCLRLSIAVANLIPCTYRKCIYDKQQQNWWHFLSHLIPLQKKVIIIFPFLIVGWLSSYFSTSESNP